MANDRKRFNRAQPQTEERESDESIIYGRNAVLEALKGDTELDKIFVKLGERDGTVSLIVSKAKERNIPVLDASQKKLDELSAHSVHQGVVAQLSQVKYAELDDIIANARDKNEPLFVVICDGINDPHNLGAVIRSAECAGAHGVIIPKRRSAAVNGTVVKSSAGAVNLIPIARVTNIAAVVDTLKDMGVFVYGAEAGGMNVYDADMNGSVAVVLGSEGDGISRLVTEKCDFIVSIPMYGRVNSYNVSCASAIILSEAARQRHKA